MKYSLVCLLVHYTRLSTPFSIHTRALSMLTGHGDQIISSLGVKRSRTDDTQVNVERDQFAQFVANRNWRFSEGFWSRIIYGSAHTLPNYVIGDVEGKQSKDRFGVSSLAEIHEAGKKGEFVSKNPKYFTRQTFALRVGYDGNKYHGYQMQKYCPGLTVEADLKEALGCNTIGAGRTDRGVSAVSQVICFANLDMSRTPEYYMDKFRASKPFQEGRLAVYDCYRVPKKFHSRASATWRRYLYMFPLNRVDGDAVELEDVRGVYEPAAETCTAKYDVDIDFINRMFSKIENLDLPYNAYAFKLDRVAGNGLQDKCTLFKVRASVVNLASAVPGTTWTPVPTPIALDPSLVRVYKKEDKPPKEGEVTASETDVIESGNEPVTDAPDAMKNAILPTDGSFPATEPMDTTKFQEDTTSQRPPKAAKSDAGDAGDGYDDGDEAEEDSYLPLAGASKAELGRGMDSTLPVEVPEGSEIPAMCIELVGSRFLRRMVRILTATAVREASKSPSERNENILLEICNSGDRERAAKALPGPPLCLAGVGYDAFDMSLYKFQPKVEANKRHAERDAENAAREALLMKQESV